MSMSEGWEAAAAAMVNDEFPVVEAEVPEPAVEPAAAPAEPDTPELTIDAQGRAHGPDGKFVASGSEEEPEATGSTEEEVPAAVGIEPEAESNEDVLELDADALGIDEDHILFTKYGGDLNAALGALAESQRIVGERANEVGSLRKENDELRQLRDEMEAFRAQMTAAQVPYQSDVDENPQGLITEVLQRVEQTGYFDQRTYEAAIQSWALEDPFGASRFDAQVQYHRAMAAQAEAQPQPEPQGPDALAAEMEAFKQRYPDAQQLLPAIEEMAVQRPVLARALTEGSAQERVQALEDLYSLAKARSTQTDTSEAVKKVILRATAEADKAKSDAAVVGASRTSAVKTEEAPTGDRLLEAALREQLGLDDFRVVDGVGTRG